MMLDTTVGTPLYEQLKRSLAGDIIKGVYSHGERLPSEIELSGIYKVSRITVRRALAELIAEGYLSSQQGKGTFVRFKKNLIQFRSFGGFTESFSDGTLSKRTTVLSKELVPADEVLAKKLSVPLRESLLGVRRIMFVDDRPYMLDSAYFPDRMYPGLEPLIQDNVSTFALLWNTYKKTFAKVDKTVGAVRAGPEEASRLECVPGDPLLWVTKVIYDPDDTPIHYSSYYVLADSCIYTLTVAGKQSDIELNFRDSDFSASSS